MIVLKRNKKYKSVSAAETINKIRNILFENDIKIKEIYHDTGIANLYSCSVQVVNEGIEHLDLSTNGKGMTLEYSLASALAELMERIQNELLVIAKGLILPNPHTVKSTHFKDNKKLLNIFEKEKLVQDYIIAADEILLSQKDIIKEQHSHLTKILHINESEDLETTIKQIGLFSKEFHSCIPYFNLNRKKINILPYKVIRAVYGSNGMCAGNNNKEAFIQGLGEIFERYVLRKIYLENVELPDIPIDYFEGQKIYNIIKEIELNKNYSIRIKDCSCGIDLPVIGVLIVDKNHQKYHFHLGSDPSPITALERCLTEIYQGTKQSLYSKFKDLANVDTYFCKDKEYTTYQKLYLELLVSFRDGTGNWPAYIFNVNKNFKGFTHPESNSDEDDIKYLLKIISDNNCEVLVRDVSFLGFPSLHIIIPGMSEMFTDFIEFYRDFNGHDKIIPTLYNLNNASNEEIEKLAKLLTLIYNANPVKTDRKISDYYPYIQDEDIKSLSIELFISMLFYRISDLENSLKYISKHINTVEEYVSSKDLYLYCARNFIELKFKGYDKITIKSRLQQFHDNNIVEEVLKDFDDPKNIFNYYNFPNCFNCDGCSHANKCSFVDVVRHISKVRNKKVTNKIDQTKLIDLLS